MKEKLILDVFYPHPPERVWKALTDSKVVAQWLMPNDFKPSLGFGFQLYGLRRNGIQTVKGVVLELDEAKRLSYSWDDGEDDAPGIVSWTLSPVDGGTQVRLEHRIMDETRPHVLIEASANWTYATQTTLPFLLHLLGAESRRPPVPMVYVAEETESDQKSLRRAGFRQEETTCC